MSPNESEQSFKTPISAPESHEGFGAPGRQSEDFDQQETHSQASRPAHSPATPPAYSTATPPAYSTATDAIDRKGGIDSFTLKILAIIGMTVNHIAHLFIPFMPWQLIIALYAFGGLTFVTMAFLMVEGYLHTSNLRKYFTRLFIFALISQVPFSLCFGQEANVLFTLLLGLFLLWAWDNVKNRGLFALILIGVVAVSYFCDWGIIGPLIVLLFYTLRDQGTRGIIITMLIPYAYTIVQALTLIVPEFSNALSMGQSIVEANAIDKYRILFFTGIPIYLSSPLLVGFMNISYALVGYTIATVCICHYNGKRGRSMKWFFYAYYPAHLLILWAIARLLTVLNGG